MFSIILLIQRLILGLCLIIYTVTGFTDKTRVWLHFISVAIQMVATVLAYFIPLYCLRFLAPLTILGYSTFMFNYNTNLTNSDIVTNIINFSAVVVMCSALVSSNWILTSVTTLAVVVGYYFFYVFGC